MKYWHQAETLVTTLIIDLENVRGLSGLASFLRERQDLIEFISGNSLNVVLWSRKNPIKQIYDGFGNERAVITHQQNHELF